MSNDSCGSSKVSSDKMGRPMSRLPETFLNELRARVPIADVIGRRVVLKRQGRDLVGCCCFHQERTPSLHVYTDQSDQHWHCFGCGQRGDVISFIMQAERKDFREAVEQLAREAGLEVPTTPEQREADTRVATILDQIRRADTHYVFQLGPSGIAYLRARGLMAETIDAAGVGWADGKEWDCFDGARARAAGLLSKDSDKPLLFRRITFPIRDRRGRTIAFTARTLSDDVQPKYLNTSNSDVFEKGKALYVTPRRMIEGDSVYLVEGPLDALSLYQAGVCSAALMSSALSAAHLEEVWRCSANPILCLDGDTAGRRATVRAICGVALPLLTPHRTLRVALLPTGEDPDTLLRGRAPNDALLLIQQATLPVEQALYELLRPLATDATARAQHLEEVLQHLATIAHRDLRYHLTSAVRTTHWQRRAPSSGGAVRALVNGEVEAARVMTATVLRHPQLVSDVHTAWESIPLPAHLAAVRGSAIAVYADDASLPEDFVGAVERRAPGLVSAVLADEPLPLPRFAQADATDAEAEAGFWHCFAVLNRQAVRAEIEAARAALRERPNPRLERRLVALTVAAARGAR